MDHQTPELPARRAAGGVVYRFNESGSPLILLIHDKYGSWTLPKGHLDDGESEQAAAIREVFEETSITGEPGPLVGEISYTVRTKKGNIRLKQVAFFLLRAVGDAAHPQAEEGISAAEWHTPAAALALIDYPQVRDILARALQMLP